MQLTQNRYIQIKESVNTMFSQYHIERSGATAFSIASKIGILITPYSLLDTSACSGIVPLYKDGFGMLREDKRLIPHTLQWLIYYNDQLSPQEQDFTILHELGHIVLGHLQDSELAETEADAFATYCINYCCK